MSADKREVMALCKPKWWRSPPAGMQNNFREGIGKNFIMGEIKSINGTRLKSPARTARRRP